MMCLMVLMVMMLLVLMPSAAAATAAAAPCQGYQLCQPGRNVDVLQQMPKAQVV